MPAPGARYFLEVNAGETETLGIGDTVDIQIITLPEPPGRSTDWISPLVSFAGVIMMGTVLVKMGKTMSDAMLVKPTERPVLLRQDGPRGEKLLPQANKRERMTPGQSPAVLQAEPRPFPSKPDKLEFLPDSMEFLAYTIDDIGYRDRLDTAFQEAMARAKRR